MTGLHFPECPALNRFKQWSRCRIATGRQTRPIAGDVGHSLLSFSRHLRTRPASARAGGVGFGAAKIRAEFDMDGITLIQSMSLFLLVLLGAVGYLLCVASGRTSESEACVAEILRNARNHPSPLTRRR